MLDIKELGNVSNELGEKTKKKFGLKEFQSTSLMLEISAVIFSPAMRNVRLSPTATPISSAALLSMETSGGPL